MFATTSAQFPARPDPSPRQRPQRQPQQPVANPTEQPQEPNQPQQEGAPCPSITVQAQPGPTVRDGQHIFFLANIQGGDPKIRPEIVWNTSAGTLTQGQSTRRVEIDTTGAGALPEREVKADLWVGGYASECQAQASGSVKIIAPATKFGEFGEVDTDTLKKNLEALTTFFAQSPDNLYLIVYAGRNSERNFSMTWARRIKDGLTVAGMEPRRVYAMDGGFREQPLFDFWIVPGGAEPPRPSPTVKRNEIVYPKATPTPVKKP
ncbi:MAG TPA: hypothetical protein VGJ02_01620 [Pyrinomonadaceae bacterium]